MDAFARLDARRRYEAVSRVCTGNREVIRASHGSCVRDFTANRWRARQVHYVGQCDFGNFSALKIAIHDLRKIFFVSLFESGESVRV